MDKEYMLELIRARLKVLDKRLKAALNQQNEQGEAITYGAAAAIRTLTLRDIGTLKVMEQVLCWSKARMYIDDEDLIQAFHRLTEPCERYRRRR